MKITGKMSQLADARQGLIDRRIYSDPDIYQQEIEQVFGRAWLFLCHDSQIPNNNDFTAGYMGEDPILATRDSKGKIHAFLNMCRHRGNRICRADHGNAPSFMCTYHGWTFSTDGKLVGVPGYKEAYFEELDRSQWGLVEVAQLTNYKGLVMGTWDRTAPSFLDYAGDQVNQLDLLLDRREGGSELMPGAHKWVIPVNWKFPADNFGTDGYHVAISHASAVQIGYGGPGRVAQSDLSQLVTASNESINGYYREHLPELKKRLGESTELGIAGGGTIFTIFPNLSLHLGRQLLHVWQPRGPMKTEVWGSCIVDKAAPLAMKQFMMHWYSHTFGPSGNLEQDDMNNWLGGTETSKAFAGRNWPMNLQMGIGHESAGAERSASGAGRASGQGAAYTEFRQRNLYAQWAEMMDGASWSDIKIIPKNRPVF